MVSDETLKADIREEIQRQGDMSAAMGWSVEPDFGAFAVAEFGDAVAIDGEPYDGTFTEAIREVKKDGWVESDTRGGKIPSYESEVQLDHVMMAVADDKDVSPERVGDIMDDMGLGAYAYPISSGRTRVFTKQRMK